MHRIAILIGGTGRGSNMKNLVQFCDNHHCATINMVISPCENEGTAWALKHGVPVIILPKQKNYEELLLNILLLGNTDGICLAGYVYLLPSTIVKTFEGRILNIHPSLLPKFGGRGMYGMHVHNAVYEAKEAETGCTVHYVNANYDDGQILIQKRCELTPDDTPVEIARKVLELEHEAYPEALNLLLDKLKQEFHT